MRSSVDPELSHRNTLRSERLRWGSFKAWKRFGSLDATRTSAVRTLAFVTSYCLSPQPLLLKGGIVADDCRYSLADISLRWMVKQVVFSQCGILFDHAALRRADIDISSIVFADPRQPTVGDFWKRGSQTTKHQLAEPVRENDDNASGGGDAEQWPIDRDVLTDSYDQLKSQKIWWMLELLPMKYAWQEASGKWNAKWG